MPPHTFGTVGRWNPTSDDPREPSRAKRQIRLECQAGDGCVKSLGFASGPPGTAPRSPLTGRPDPTRAYSGPSTHRSGRRAKAGRSCGVGAEWKRGVHGESAFRSGTGAEVTAVKGGPLAHRDQAMPGSAVPSLGLAARSVIEDLDVEAPRCRIGSAPLRMQLWSVSGCW